MTIVKPSSIVTATGVAHGLGFLRGYHRVMSKLPTMPGIHGRSRCRLRRHAGEWSAVLGVWAVFGLGLGSGTTTHAQVAAHEVQSPLSANEAQVIDQLRAENAALRERIATLEAELAAVTRRLNDLDVQRASADPSESSLATANSAPAIASANGSAGAQPSDRDRILRRALGRFTTATNSDGLVQHTSEQSRMQFIRGAARRHLLSAVVVEPAASEAADSNEIHLFIQTSQTGGDYDRQTVMSFEFEGTAIAIEPASYAKVGANRRANETLRYTLTAEQARQIADAPTVTGNLGRSVFELTVEQQDALAGAAALVEGLD